MPRTIKETVKAAVTEVLSGVVDEDLPKPTRLLAQWTSLFVQQPGVASKVTIHKVDKDGVEARIYQMTDPTGVTDIEDEVFQLAQKNQWGAGDYEARLWGPPSKPAKDGSTVPFVMLLRHKFRIIPPTVIQEPMTEASKVLGAGVSMVKEVAAAFPRSNDSGDVGKAMAEALKAGVAAAAPNQSLLAELIKKPDTPPWVGQLLTGLIPVVSTFLTRQEKKPELVETVEGLQRLGLLAPPQEGEDEGGFESEIERLQGVMGLLQSLGVQIGPGGGEGGSWVNALSSPFMNKTLQELFIAAGKWADVFLSRRVGVAPPMYPTQPMMPSMPPAPQPSPPSPLAQAIQQGNTAVFPQLETMLVQMAGGRPLITALRNGEVTFDLLLQQGLGQHLPEFNLPGARPFFDRFIAWLREKTPQTIMPTPAPPPESGTAPIDSPPSRDKILAKCEKCPSEYGFPDRAAWDQDSKVCDDCGGLLSLVAELP